MGLSEEIAQLATNLGSVSTPANYPAIKKVYSVPPVEGSGIAPPTTEDVPAIVVFLRRPPLVSAFTFGVERRDTTYTVQFIYTPVGFGVFADSYKACLAYCEPILDVLWQHQTLNNTANVNWSRPIQETLPQKLPDVWGGQEYFGVDFSIACVSSRGVTIST